MRLRSIELNVPDAQAAGAFFTDIWGVADAGEQEGGRYLTGSNGFPYLVALTEAETPSIRCLTFSGDGHEVEAIVARARAFGASVQETVSRDPGGGSGVIVQSPEGALFRFLHGDTVIAAPIGRDLPVKLTHVVLNATDAEASADFAERVFGFHVSDRTKGMVFVRCNAAHHPIAFARAGHTSLNHIAFEMEDLDAVMRGIGRLRDAGLSPAWGPGRHGPGANVFAYYIAPFGAVVEFSTAVAIIGDDYPVGAPEDWTWPENRIDHWGLSDKQVSALAEAERIFRFAPLSALNLPAENRTMRLISFRHAGRDSYGVVRGETVIDLGAVAGAQAPDLVAALKQDLIEDLSRRDGEAVPLSAVELLPVVTNPGKIFCVGHNYETHRAETGRARVGHPSIFLRFADTLTPHGGPIVRPGVSTSLDYEGELAIVISKGGRHIAEADAMDHIAGFACANDASVRDWQWHTQQFTPGKNFPATCGLGPWLVTPDEIDDLDAVTVTTRLNGEVMQYASLADLIFPLPVIIAYLSTFTPLSPGDVILTGTPGGVGAKRQPPVWMKAGDMIEIEIAGVGLLRNTIVDEG